MRFSRVVMRGTCYTSGAHILNYKYKTDKICMQVDLQVTNCLGGTHVVFVATKL